VPYAHIPSKFTYVAMGSSLWLWTSVVLALISICTGIAALFHADVERFAWLVWGMLALSASSVFLIKRRTFRVFHGGQPPLVMFEGLPNQAAFDAFLAELHSLRLQWLADRALAELRGQPGTLREHLRRLHDTGFLSDSEVLVLSNRLSNRSTLEQPQPPLLN
jgi:hypothetical protein